MASASVLLNWFPGTLYNFSLNAVSQHYKCYKDELQYFPAAVHADVLYKVCLMKEIMEIAVKKVKKFSFSQ